MQMTIDKAILRVEHSSMSVDDKETADFIVNTMRKYQKIEQILKEPCINVVGSITDGVQNIVVTECMTNAEVFAKIYGYQPETDSVVCNKGEWCGFSEPCKYCSHVGDAIGREEDWWNSPYKRGGSR